MLRMTNSTYLSRPDWEKLDELLSRHGFGGYYDLVEGLRLCVTNLGVGNTGVMPENITTLPEIVKLLKDWTWTLSGVEGFNKLVLQVTKKPLKGRD